MIALQLGNAFGIDGRSLWMNAVAIGSERGLSVDLAGRHLANALVAAPLLLAVAVATGLFTGHPGSIFWGLCAGLGILGIGFGIGSVTSVVIPFTVPERLNAFTGAAPGQGGQAIASAMMALTGIVLLSMPFVVAVIFGALWVCAFAPLYGLVAEVLGRRLGSKIGFARLPDVLAAVSKPT
jgi:ABC-2 type transport system permease protein